MKIIKVPFTKLKTIIQLGDIHIRLYKRHEEYKQAFEKLYAQLRRKDMEEAIIYVAGDLLHAKTDLSPESIQLASSFLTSLADIAPTILIAGNHDSNLSNKSRLDSLTPIVNNINHPNLHYLRDSGVYRVADTDIAVFSIFDSEDKWPKASELSSDNKLVLYHGAVRESETDLGYVIKDSHITLDKFAGYTFGLFGDIHKHQLLTDGKLKAVYCSSLIQQNHGETLRGHGWVEWNLVTGEYVFRNLDNDYGYCTVLLDGVNDYRFTDFPKNVRLRMFAHDTSETNVANYLKTIKSNVVELTVNKLIQYADGTDKAVAKYDFSDIKDITRQNNIILEWITNKYVISDATKKQIIDINTDLNTRLNQDELPRSIRWNPLCFEFSNMFSYGEDNVIDFKNCNGTYGLFGENASGKSSIFDALMYCIFDKSPRAFKADSVLNNRKDSFASHLTFEMAEDTYHIERVGKRKKDGTIRVDVNFWKEDSSGKIVDLNGEERRITNNNIRLHLGNYEDFILTNFSVQNNNASFIDKTQSERKDLLMQLLGLQFFDTLYTYASDDSRMLSAKIKELTSKNYNEIGILATQRLHELKATGSAVSDTIRSLKIEIENFNTEIQVLLQTKKPVSSKNLNITQLNPYRDVVEKKLAEMDTQLAGVQVKLYEARHKKEEYEVMVAAGKATQDEFAKFATLKSAIVVNKAKYDSATKAYNECVKLEEQLKKFEYNPDCEYCVKNPFVIDAEKKIKGLQDLQSSMMDAEENWLVLDDKLKELQSTKIEERYADFGAAVYNFSQYSKAVDTLLASNDSLEKSRKLESDCLIQVITDIAEYHADEANILFNQDVNVKVTQHKSSLLSKTSDLDSAQKELTRISADAKVQMHILEDATQKTDELTKCSDEYQGYEHYLQALSRDGVPYSLIQKVVPIIETEVNSILTQLVDFTIKFDTDGKNVNARIKYETGDWPIELSSGMERFISSLAIRVALTAVSNLPKSNFLIIDEGLGALSAENLASMSLLFGLLKAQYKFIMIVSHIDTVRDMVEKILEIRQENGFSKIFNN